MISYGVNPACYKCLCRVCGAAACPHKLYGYPSRCDARCWNCFGGYRAHPILDCDFFYFKMFPKYRIKRIYRKPKIRYVDKTNADDIRIMLTEILRLISADERARSDINCVRNKCLCLSCPIFSSCSDRCSLCHDYPGQRPVKLCGKRLQIER